MDTDKSKRHNKPLMEIIHEAIETGEYYRKLREEKHPEITERRKMRDMHKHNDNKRERRIIDIDKQIRINKMLKRK